MIKRFSQGWNLRFSDSSIEKVFKEECSKLHLISSSAVTLGLLILSAYMIILTSLPVYFLIFFITPLLPRSFLKHITLEAASFVFLNYHFAQGTIPEFFGTLLPSFLLQFFIWKRWELFSLLSLCKILIICQCTYLPNGLLVVGSYTFFAFLLEKDFRRGWANMKLEKESNQLYSELWMKIPCPVFIMSQKFNLLAQNISASQTYQNITQFQTIFTEENCSIINRSIKKIFMGQEKDQVLIKERNLFFMVYFKNVEWKFERCAEISIIEMEETQHFENIFNEFCGKQEKTLESLYNTLLQSYHEGSEIKSETLETFYNFCINYWSYQVILEQHTENAGSKDLVVLDIPCEITNSIEFVNLQSREKRVDYRFHNETTSSVSVLGNESRIKLFFYVVIDCSKKNSDSNSIVEFILQSFQVNNSICYTFTSTFVARKIDKEEISMIFNNKVQGTEDLYNFITKYDLSYATVMSNMRALNISLKSISYNKSVVTLSFLIRLEVTALPCTSQPLHMSTNRVTARNRVTWYNQEKSLKKSMKRMDIQTQDIVSIEHASDILLFKRISINSPGSAEGYIEYNHCPRSMPNILNISSFSNILEIDYPKPKRANTLTRVLKSKNNQFGVPMYLHTNKRPPKKFLFKECVKGLNYELGVYKILIADDMEDNRKRLQNLLGKFMDVSCEFAKSGRGAVEMYNSYSSLGYMYRIIFMDLVMPQMSGYEASQKIRQTERSKGLPQTYIVAITGDKDCLSKYKQFEINDIGKF